MSDPRLVPDPARTRLNESAAVCIPVADLNRRPGGPRDRQLLYGDAVRVLDRGDGWAYVQAEKDGYCGYLSSEALGPQTRPTHRISARASHAYDRPDFKSPDRVSLSLGSRVTSAGEDATYAETELGFIPLVHLAPLDRPETDPAETALRFLGAPYLWGGNSAWGIDCSGLVQAVLLACGHPCPGDSDMQESLGRAATGGYQRNDLLFWKGHVALVLDEGMLIHANAAAMATTCEGIEDAMARIAAQGDGPITAHRRL